MNNSLREGTQFEYIEHALKQGYAVLVMNTNHNEFADDGKKVRIPLSETPQDHAANVWREIVAKVLTKQSEIGDMKGLLFVGFLGSCKTLSNSSTQLRRYCDGRPGRKVL